MQVHATEEKTNYRPLVAVIGITLWASISLQAGVARVGRLRRFANSAETAVINQLLLFIFKYLRLVGGQRGIRTPDGVAPIPVFETSAFNHSAICPCNSGFSGLGRFRQPVFSGQ